MSPPSHLQALHLRLPDDCSPSHLLHLTSCPTSPSGAAAAGVALVEQEGSSDTHKGGGSQGECMHTMQQCGGDCRAACTQIAPLQVPLLHMHAIQLHILE
jgi:hypothetical protein